MYPSTWLGLGFLACVTLSLANPLRDVKRQVIQDNYDFIVCGGGTAGLVLANRLSESGKQTVLVLEDGHVPNIVASYKTPGGNQFLGGTSLDWSFYTTPQENINDRILGYHRGRGLGGSSSINGLFYGRGSASVYDQWDKIGNPGWGWSDVWPLFKKSSLRANKSPGNPLQPSNYKNLTGEFTAPSGITNAFQKLSEAELNAINANAIISQGLANQSHIECLYEAIWYPGGPTPYYTPQGNESYISLTASSMVALSRGNITLRSDSMADAPLINPNYYEDPTDRAMAIAAFKYLRRILAHPALSQFTTGPNHGEVSPGAAVADDDENGIFNYVKATTIPNWHASGTNQMRPLEDGGVVDSRLKVYGVGGLRIVDCSVIPVLPDVNIVGPVFMIGEKGAQMIR